MSNPPDHVPGFHIPGTNVPFGAVHRPAFHPPTPAEQAALEQILDEKRRAREDAIRSLRARLNTVSGDPVRRFVASVWWSAAIGANGTLMIPGDLYPVVNEAYVNVAPHDPLGRLNTLDPLVNQATLRAWFIREASAQGLQPDTKTQFWVQKRTLLGKPAVYSSGVPVMKLTPTKPAWTLVGSSGRRVTEQRLMDYWIPADDIGEPQNLQEGMTAVGVYQMGKMLGL